ncbi:ABC transporter ATP-binding protein [Pseudalkalibacillus caeni]|uniref:ABC transporter ATP-binding protein n=1 Tax=Exobacillus caeni TaxID=2574798 RepID=A0A5R9F5N8_9BACL|nr:ABC transporter ATP-binding protein [Pseudalkalibacillus caeni]TLS36948.1 ABC transporter ATP-binding protein [Pseudalkalibacillus caeni]
MSDSVLAFNSIAFHYQTGKKKEAVSIFDGIDFRVNDGEFVSIIGPSGSGKSTIFRLVTGLENPAAGEIFLNGKKTENRLGQVGYMPQQDLLMPWRTIKENAVLPLEIKGMKKAEAESRVLQLLDDFGLKGVEDKYPGDLSGGMRQRVSFLRSILSGSNILLLDEPFSALDAITRLSMQEWLLAQWQKWKKTILFITHDVDEALFLSDRIFVLTGRPNHQLTEVTVPLGRPRTVRDLSRPEVVTLKEQLIDQLRSKELS